MTQLPPNSYSSHLPVFPLEIFDLILRSLVDGSDRFYPSPCSSDVVSTLRVCAVVCRSFLPLCRPHLFHDVEIGPTFPSARRRLAELITRKPELSKHIRRLSYHRTTSFFRPGDVDIANLLPILNLPNVHTLSIRTIQSKQQTRIRYYDDEGFRKFFDHFLSTGKLTTLHLHGVLGAPISQILTAPRLKSLIVDSVIFSEWGPFFAHGCVDPSTSTPKIRVKKFSLHETEFDLAALAYFTDLEDVSFGSGWPMFSSFGAHQDDALSFPKLHALSIRNEFDPVLTICCAAKRAGITAFPNVTDVNISLDTHKGINSDDIDVIPSLFWYHLPAMESLNIRLSVSRQSVRAYCLLRLDHCLRMCKSSLKRLCIQARLSNVLHVRDVIQPLHYYLELARGDNAIEVIDIPLFISPAVGDVAGRPWDTKAARSHTILLRWLLTLLSDRSRCGFPELRSVVFRVWIERSGSGKDNSQCYRRYLVDELKQLEGEQFPFFYWKLMLSSSAS